MRKIEAAGTGFIKLEGHLINLKAYKAFGPRKMGYDEDPTGRIVYAIAFTPSVPSAENIENNVDGTWLVGYGENEKKDYEADCKELTKATNPVKELRIIWQILIPLAITIIGGLILLGIEKGWFIGLFNTCR